MSMIMVIDDDRQFCRLIKKILELEGYQVTTFTDIEHAWESLRQSLPDVICSDMNMPGASGFDFLKRRQDIEGLESVPFVSITGNYSHASQVKATELGAYAYLTKPFKPKELSSIIESALARATPG